MIHVDGRYDGQRRVDYVRRVQAPAQADFDHRRLHASTRETTRTPWPRRSQSSSDARRDRANRRPDAPRRTPARTAPAHRDAVDLNTLGGFDQVGRSEEPGANPRRPQARRDHRAGRTFAIGPGDMDHAVRLLRIAQGGENRADALEPQLGGLHLVAQRVQELDGIGIVHDFLVRRYTTDHEA